MLSDSAARILRRHQLLACITAAFPIGIIVDGGYLWWFFAPPEIFGLSLPAWTGMMRSITLSSLITTAVIGYALLMLCRRAMVEPLKSLGLKVR